MNPGLCTTCVHRGPWRYLFAHPVLEADCAARGEVVDSWTMPEACGLYEAAPGCDADAEGRRASQGGAGRVNWLQVLLAALSGAGIFFISQGQFVVGCSLGLAAQPLWIRETYRARQWGMFALSLWYTLAWGNGLFVNLAR